MCVTTTASDARSTLLVSLMAASSASCGSCSSAEQSVHANFSHTILRGTLKHNNFTQLRLCSGKLLKISIGFNLFSLRDFCAMLRALEGCQSPDSAFPVSACTCRSWLTRVLLVFFNGLKACSRRNT